MAFGLIRHQRKARTAEAAPSLVPARMAKLGSGMEAGTQMGPLVSEEQLTRVSGYLESGKAEGAP